MAGAQIITKGLYGGLSASDNGFVLPSARACRDGDTAFAPGSRLRCHPQRAFAYLSDRGSVSGMPFGI